MKRLTAATLVLLLPVLAATAFFGQKKSLKIEYPGKIVDCQGVCALRPTLQERWTPIETGMLMSKGDRLRTDIRGANAFQARIGGQHTIIAGPGSLLELVDENTVRIIRGEVELTPARKASLTLLLPGDKREKITSPAVYRVSRDAASKLANEPNWLKYFKGTVTHESMGSLVAKVEGRNTPLTLGYHKVTVDIRDQIARTVIEESFVNHTRSRLEGVFYFPLPQDASISGFAMWIGDELVEADVVEKQRAREIYETILRERRDPGLLEWSGGNIFKARVFPIFPHSEKRIKITYTQVLPMDGSRFRYRYALQSEMLRQNPLRELALNVKINSALPLKNVVCPSHETQISKTEYSAHLKFSAQEYTPSRDLEVEVELDKSRNEVTVIPHRRGEDGYFLLLVNPPEAKKRLRPLIGDGPPLDLIIVADTSASMDRHQRRLQDEFIAFLLGSLGKKDRFRLATGDKDARWFHQHAEPAAESPDAPPPAIAATDESIEMARSFLSRQVSLGWTDLNAIFSRILKAAGENSHIVYIGDAIDTSGDSDPVATSKALKRLHAAAGGNGTIHAVATSSSFEPLTLKSLAGLGGGSFRQLEGETPARTGAMDLLEELTRPGMRNMKVEFKGVRVARVYPDELPNLPAGRQQIMIGRYLPEGRDQRGTVTVSGEYKGKTVEYKAPVILKDAESGNSFIPRLWARMHLDSLLDQGRTPEVKADVISLSEEYSIMTPYTSFLVLESDADRERFAVKRRFKMRDGEKFFAEGRDAANFELRQKQMRLAGQWRKNLRRKMLRELLSLGRQLPRQQHPYGGRPRGDGACMTGGGGRNYRQSLLVRGRSPITENEEMLSDFSVGGEGPIGADEGMDMVMDDAVFCERQDLDGYFDDAEKDMKMAEALEEAPAFERLASSPEPSMAWSKKRASYAADPMACEPMPAPRVVAKGLGPASFVSMSGAKRKANAMHGGGYSLYWLNQLFPQPLAPPPAPANNWPDNARKLAHSLLRQDDLDSMAGGVEITCKHTTYDANTQKETSRREFHSLYSPRKWIQTSGGDHRQTLIAWYDGESRGLFAPCYQLGKRRAAGEADGKFFASRLPGYGTYAFRSIDAHYPNGSVALTPQGKDTVLLVFHYAKNRNYRMEFLIDTRREVLLRFETYSNETRTQRTSFSKFVKVADCWWATELVGESADGKPAWKTSFRITPLDKKALETGIADGMADIEKALVINDPLPDYAAAKQAELDEALTFEHHLGLISYYLGTSQHDRTREQWQAARKLVAGQPGLDWIDMELLITTRRREEARKLILAKSRLLVDGESIDELYLANRLNNQMSRCGQTNERIVLLDALKTVFERQSKRLRAMRTWQENYAQALQNVGRTEESLKLRRTLAEKNPDDVNLQTSYATQLVNHGDTDEAVRWIDALLAKPERWNRNQRDSIRASVAYQFMNRLPGDEWLKMLEAWIADETLNSSAYAYYLTGLLRMDRLDETRKVMTRWIEDGLAAHARPAGDKPDETRQRTMVKMQAAVQAALGQGYNMHHNYIDPYWHDLLAKTARAMFGSKTHGNMSNRIISHHNFRNTDQARTLRRHFISVLGKEAGTLDPALLNQVIGWVSINNPRVDEEIWTDVVRRLEERWATEEDPSIRDQVGQSLITILYNHDRETGLVRFLRRQMKEGPKDFRARYVGRLYNELLGRDWSDEYENELFALLPRLDTPNDDRFPVEAIVPRLYALVDRLVAARTKALSSSNEKKGKMSRTELAAERKRTAAEAREGMIARLTKEMQRQEKALHPWLVAERLYLEMKLKKDAKQIIAECWELLPREPWTSMADPDGKESLNWFDLHLLDRSLVTLSCLAAKQSADPALVKRVSDYIDLGLARSTGKAKDSDESVDHGLYWRFQKYRLLVARDEPRPLEKALRSWVAPEKADPTWPLALGYLMAEQDRIPEAVKLFERLDQSDSLGASDIRSLANWYMVLGDRAKHEEMLVKALMPIPEHRLSSQLYRYLSPWQRHGGKMPEELDPEAIRIFTALFRKAQRPQNYIYRIRDFYRHTRDFRLLACLAEGMIGHSAQRAYPYVKNLYSVLNDVRDEAVADTIMEHLAKVRKRASTRVDNRALDFLEVQVRRRAAEVINQPGQHGPKALAAMKRAFAGEWAPGERRLMADLVASLGKPSLPALAAEQLRQMKTLSACRTEPPQDKLFIARRYAETLWLHKQREQALDALTAGLEEFREHSGGTLPGSANNAMGTLIRYFEETKRFSDGERWLKKEAGRPANQHQRNWLTRRLLRLYIAAIRSKGSTSLGSGQALHDATYFRIVAELDSCDQNHRRDLINIVCDLFRRTKSAKLKPTHLRAFAFKVMPTFLKGEHDQHGYHSHISYVGNVMRDVIGPLPALEFLVERLEQEPEWLRRTRWNSGWARHSSSLGRYRGEAKNIGGLEPRLLAIVLRELRRDLRERRRHSSSIYCKHHYYWKEKEAEFVAVAEDVYRKRRTSGQAVEYIAGYMWGSLHKYSRAIAMLLDAYKNQRLTESGKSNLVTYLHSQSRHGESIPVLKELIGIQPNNINYRSLMITAYAQVSDVKALKETVAETDRHFHEHGLWQEHVIATLASACIRPHLYEHAVKYYGELIPMHKRRMGRRTQSSTLSTYYKQLAHAHSGLKQTVEAVEAASGAIVVWGSDHRNRRHAVDALNHVLKKAHDLPAYVAHLDKQAEEAGLENPIVRKAVGQIFLERKNYKEAIRNLTLAVEAQPNDADMHKALVHAYDRMRDPEGAVKQLLASVELSRRNIELFRDLGDRYKRLNNEEYAERAYLSIAEMLPNESESHTMLAEIRKRQNRWDDVIHHWRQVTRIRTLEPTGFQNLAEAQIHQKQWKDALETIEILESKNWPPRFGNIHSRARQLRRSIPEAHRE